MDFEEIVAPKSSAPIEADNTPLPKPNPKNSQPKAGDPEAGRLLNKKDQMVEGRLRTLGLLSFRMTRTADQTGWPKEGHAVEMPNVRFSFWQSVNENQCWVLFDVPNDQASTAYVYVFENTKPSRR